MIASTMAADFIENRTYGEIEVGDSATLTRTLRPEDIQLFAVMSGDVNPAHVDPEYAHSSMFQEVIAHGMWGGALISTVLGTEFPGPGTIYISQTLRFSRPVKVGDTITIKITCRQKFDHNKHITFDCLCTNQDGLKVISGEAEVLAPTGKIKRERVELPEVTISDRWSRYHKLIARAKGLPPATAVFAHPIHPESLQSAAVARDTGILRPVLVGSEKEMRAVAEENKIDLKLCRLVDAPHSRAALARALEMARSGEAEILVQGGIPTHEFLIPIVGPNGLRSVRRLSHVLYMDVPSYPRPFVISDMMVNIEPTLEDKIDIVQNAIDFAHIMGIAEPKVAILAGIDRVTPKMRATLDAAALCKMADRGQITGAVLDGPLGFDNAVSITAARNASVKSAVAGQADVLIAPDLEAGNMLAKQLEHLSDAVSGGVVLGARIPIVLANRNDSIEGRVASLVLSLLVANHLRASR
ncbi:MAG TPA: bifunctional enoyl-CoA hydratase/phosphate acetyltransferase [Burkholderiales bacterium]|nr:bifunctional enoyl-CoA hydratase/phosphate acetyltransferase [Burkholderiales bacterium]